MATLSKRRWIVPGSSKKSRGWQVTWTNSEGQVKRKLFAWDAKSAAEAFRQSMERLSSGAVGAEKRTIADACDKFMQIKETEGLERSTTDGYERHIRLHIKPAIGGVRLIDFNLAAADAFISALIAGLSVPMAVKVRDTLRQVIDRAIRWQWTLHNSIDQTEVKERARHKGKVDIPSHDEMHRIIEAMGDPDGLYLGQVFFATMLNTGMRPSELRGLTDTDHTLNLKTAPFSITIGQRADQWGKIGSPKSGAGHRTIPISGAHASLMRAWLLRRPPSKHGLVFPTGTGEPQNYSNIINRIWTPALKQAGLMVPHPETPNKLVPKYTPYSVRHYYASMLIDMGANPKKVQQRMGHSNIQITLDTYGHLWKDDEADAKEVAELERRLSGGTV